VIFFEHEAVSIDVDLALTIDQPQRWQPESGHEEEVAKINPDLVACNTGGHPESVHYEMVNAMLLNKFPKEHRPFVKEQFKVAKSTEIDVLKEELKEQRYLIQKVSDKIDVSQSTTRVAERES